MNKIELIFEINGKKYKKTFNNKGIVNNESILLTDWLKLSNRNKNEEFINEEGEKFIFNGKNTIYYQECTITFIKSSI